jgi:hypothetical protein
MTATIVLTIDSARRRRSSRARVPADAPRGRHPSVTRALPRLLDAIGLRATFFVEPINTQDYPGGAARDRGTGTSLASTPGGTSAGVTSAPTASRRSSTAASRPSRSSASTSGRSVRPAAGD